jgi:hypothetical protein
MAPIFLLQITQIPPSGKSNNIDELANSNNETLVCHSRFHENDIFLQYHQFCEYVNM